MTPFIMCLTCSHAGEQRFAEEDEDVVADENWKEYIKSSEDAVETWFI